MWKTPAQYCAICTHAYDERLIRGEANTCDWCAVGNTKVRSNSIVIVPQLQAILRVGVTTAYYGR